MTNELLGWLLITATNAVVVTTISVGLPFHPVRAWLKDNIEIVWETVQCPYCLAHWTSLIMMLLARPDILVLDPLIFFLAWGTLVYVTTLFNGVLYALPPLNKLFKDHE